jgi:hypothetical protein
VEENCSKEEMTISTVSCPAFRRGERDEGMKGLDMK